MSDTKAIVWQTWLLPPFSLIRNFGKQNTRRNVSKISESCMLLTDRIEIHQLQPLVWPSNLLYVMPSGCDWWISIRSVNNMQDMTEILETFPRVFCFPKSRINENGGKMWDFKMDQYCGNWTWGRAILIWNHTCDFKLNSLHAHSILKSPVWFQAKLHSTQFNYHNIMNRLADWQKNNDRWVDR